MEIVDGALRGVPHDGNCRACGHSRGSHLAGVGCHQGVDGKGCPCGFFVYEPAIIERLLAGGREGGTGG